MLTGHVDDGFVSIILSHFLLRGTILMLYPLKWMEVEFAEGFLHASFGKGVFTLFTKPHSVLYAAISPEAL